MGKMLQRTLVAILMVGISTPIYAKTKYLTPIERSTNCSTASATFIPRLDLTSQPSYPPIANGQTEYTIPATDTCAHLSLLKLPANFLLLVAPGISTIQWQVDQIQFGPGATFDLSGSQIKLPKPPKPPTEGQANYCAYGHQGANGASGKNGDDAVNLVITGLQAITNSSGGLWIRNDGGPGQDAGDAGDGQKGGGHLGTWPFECQRHAGGPPGYLLSPGSGGKTSVVSISDYPIATLSVFPSSLGKKPVKVVKIMAPAGACGPSSRPPNTISNTASIIVFGQPGCNGKPGTPGRPGG